MPASRLYKLPLDPDRVEEVRSYFEALEGRRETFERGLAVENMRAETAWLDTEEPALYYLHDEGEGYPADVDVEDLDEDLRKLSAEHHGFFETVAAEGHDHPEDLREFEELFHARASDGGD
jgi:hypothetical protein